jgi:starvation-inducible DNA-binding protein
MMTTVSEELDTPGDLKNDKTAAVAAPLNKILADSFALYMKTKNFHWHVSGPHFQDYHLLLDSQAAQILASTDAIAERIRKTGRTTLRSISDIGGRQRILDNDKDFVPAIDMLEELRKDNLALIGWLGGQGPRGRRQGQCDIRRPRRMDCQGRGTGMVLFETTRHAR